MCTIDRLGIGRRIPLLGYLATPYAAFPGPRSEAFHHAILAAAIFVDYLGPWIFSPIAHNHLLAMATTSQPDDPHRYWLDADFPYLVAADCLIVVQLPGWCQSIGIAEEIRIMTAMNKPIFYWDINDGIPNDIRDFFVSNNDLIGPFV